MEYSETPMSPAYYRPGKLLRPLRRQLPAVWLISIAIAAGILMGSWAWRNLLHERATRNVSVQRARIDTLKKEIHQVRGEIGRATSVSYILRWAREHRGWGERTDGVQKLSISADSLTNGAREELKLVEEMP